MQVRHCFDKKQSVDNDHHQNITSLRTAVGCQDPEGERGESSLFFITLVPVNYFVEEYENSDYSFFL